MRAVIQLLSMLCFGLGLLMSLPALYAASIEAAATARAFLACGAGIVVVAGAVLLALRDTAGVAGRFAGIVLAALAWPVLAAFAALPYVVTTDMRPALAYFDALSAITTTGFHLQYGLVDLENPLILWRAVLQWYGGLLTLAMLVLILSPLGIGGLPQRTLAFMSPEAHRRGSAIARHVVQLAATLFILAVFCTLWLTASGVALFDAVCLAFSAVSTGGLVPRPGGLDTYVGAAGQFGLIVFMAIGATSIVWQGMVARFDRHGLTGHRESYMLLGAMLIVGLVIGEIAHQNSGGSVSDHLSRFREGLFTAVSLLSTTGFHVREHSFSVLPVAVVLIAAAVGGGALSTAGGVKVFRVGVMITDARRHLTASLFPHAVHSRMIGSRPWNARELQGGHVMVLGFAASLAVTVMMLGICGLTFEEASAAAVAALANIGPIYDGGPDAARPWIEPVDMNGLALGVLDVAMVAGRIEILALASVFNFVYWRQR